MRLTCAFAVCMLLFGLFGGDHGLGAMLRARRQARALGAQIEALRAENAQLRRRAAALRSDPRTIETVARATLGLVRRDEIVVRYRPSTVR